MRDDTIIQFSKAAPVTRQLEPHDKWVIVRHGLAVLWALAFLFFTSPASYSTIASAVVTGACAGLVVVGALAAAYGRITFRHKTVELWGLSALVFGWASYIVLVVVNIIAVDLDLRRGGVFTLAVFALTVPMERWLFLLVAVLEDAGIVKTGIRIRRNKR